MFKKHKVVMLKTNEKALLALDEIDGDMVLGSRNDGTYINQHLYILSDEEIKEGDWVFCLREGYEPILQQKVNPEGVNKDPMMKKIIATTDENLKWYMIGFLPQPSHSFTEKYVEEYNKGNVITDVMVEYHDTKYIGAYNEIQLEGKIKINPRDNTITIRKVKDSWSREEVHSRA